jgi:hypothetical protein
MIGMLRRLTAFLAMLALLGLVLLLMWNVYLHHQRGSGDGQPRVVELARSSRLA